MRLQLVNDKQICELYLSGISLVNLGLRYFGNRNQYCKIKNILIKNDIEIRTISERNSTYSIDRNYFNKIDTEEKAYFLGFLYADGANTRNCITLSLKNDDIKIIETFSKLLKTDRPVITYTNKTNSYSRLSINNHIVVNDLIRHGIVERKTFKIKYPDIDPLLDSHFIRGYFDGDGGFKFKRKKNQYSMCITSNNNFCIDLQNKIYSYTNIKLGIYPIYANKESEIKRLECGGNKQVVVLSNWLYNNSTIYLDRKYNQYINLLNNPIGRK
jgi:hypothetical protein